VIRYEAGSRQVSRFHWRRVVDVTTTKTERNSFSHFPEKTRVFSREANSRAILIFLHVSPLFSIESTTECLLDENRSVSSQFPVRSKRFDVD